MARLFGLSKEWVARIHPLFSKERGVSGSMTERCCAASSMGPEGVCTGMDAPAAAGPHKTVYNRCRGWSGRGVLI